MKSKFDQLEALLPSHFQLLTNRLWIRGGRGDHFYQAEGQRVRMSQVPNGWKVTPETYETVPQKKLRVGKATIYPDFDSAIAAAEQDVHSRVEHKEFIPNESWKVTPATERQKNYIRAKIGIGVPDDISRWDAQGIMNEHFEGVRSRPKKKSR